MDERITVSDIREVLTKDWMTHDAMWFYSCFKEFGMEKASMLNKSAISLLGPIETKRMLKALSMQDETFDSFDKVKRFFHGAREFVIPEWMNFAWSMEKKNILEWQWIKCFAYDGISRLGAVDRYECGVMFRIETWLKALGVKYEMTPAISGCLMHQFGECKGEIRFMFD
jgi:hypothetical protein